MLVRLLIGQRAGEIVEMKFAQAQHLIAAGQAELPDAANALQDLSASPPTAATVSVPIETAAASANEPPVQAPAKRFSGLPIPQGPRGKRSRANKSR